MRPEALQDPEPQTLNPQTHLKLEADPTKPCALTRLNSVPYKARNPRLES